MAVPRTALPARWRIAIWAAILASVGLLCVYFWLSAPTTLDQDATTIIEAALDNDPETVYRYVFHFQKDATGVTKERFAQMWRTLIEPRMRGIERVDDIKAEVFRGDHQGQAWTTVRLPSGATFTLGTAPQATDHGGGIGMLEFLNEAWHIEYVYEKGLPQQPKSFIEARLRGIMNDRNMLESLGFEGIPPGMPGEKVTPWGAAIENLQKWLRKLEAAENEQVASE